jgi:hypothetical protein
LGLRSFPRQRPSLRSRELRRSGILVYSVNVFRQSSGDDCEVPERHFCGHSPHRRSAFRRRPIRRWHRSDIPVSLVCSGLPSRATDVVLPRTRNAFDHCEDSVANGSHGTGHLSSIRVSTARISIGEHPERPTASPRLRVLCWPKYGYKS